MVNRLVVAVHLLAKTCAAQEKRIAGLENAEKRDDSRALADLNS
jgi:hypothetical protein